MIELRKINKTYTNNGQPLTILKNFSHRFKEGSVTSILGESGSGKTTLLNLIGGIDLDFQGDLVVDGEFIDDFDDFDRLRREHVSFIFQDLNLISHLSLIKNITVGLTNDVKHKDEKAKELLRKVGLYDHRDKKPHQLSGGERQRVAIARALARETDILLCDEPTGSLDDQTKVEIMDLIMEVFKGKTIIFVTHDEELANDYSDTILSFGSGGIVKKDLKEVTLHKSEEPESDWIKSFNKRFEFNILARKFSLFNASYLIIIISALFLFGTGVISGIETEVDNYYIDKYKVDKIDVRTRRFTINGFRGFVDQYNKENLSQIIGFMSVLDLETTIGDGEPEDGDVAVFDKELMNIHPNVAKSLKRDMVAGTFPKENLEVLYSKGSAIETLINEATPSFESNQDKYVFYEEMKNLSDDELLTRIQDVEIGYKNTYRYNDERFYDKDLKIVGLIDDYKYYDNEEVTYKADGESTSIMTNSSIYMLEEEYLDFIFTVYLGYNDLKFTAFSIFVEEEDFDLRNAVFDGFLLHGFQISGRDYITNERNDYHETIHGYKIALNVGCLILMIFGGLSIYNGVQTNIVKNKKNIGIYKSLGYTSNNIKSMYIAEGGIIAVFTIVLSLVFWLVFRSIMNDFIVDALDPTNKFAFGNIAYLDPLALGIVIAVVVTIIMTSIQMEFSKLDIMSLIKHK